MIMLIITQEKQKHHDLHHSAYAWLRRLDYPYINRPRSEK
jgi:hypothetical protein